MREEANKNSLIGDTDITEMPTIGETVEGVEVVMRLEEIIDGGNLQATLEEFSEVWQQSPDYEEYRKKVRGKLYNDLLKAAEEEYPSNNDNPQN